MKDFINQFAPIWAVGFAGGCALGVMLTIYCYFNL